MLHELPGIITKAKFNCSGSTSLSDTDCFGQSPGDLKQVHLSSGARGDRRWRRCDSEDLQLFLCSVVLKSNCSAIRCCFRLKTFQCGSKPVKPGASKQAGSRSALCLGVWALGELTCSAQEGKKTPTPHRQVMEGECCLGCGELGFVRCKEVSDICSPAWRLVSLSFLPLNSHAGERAEETSINLLSP